MPKVILQFPEELLKRTDAETKQQKLRSRSAFIRAAVQEKIQRHQKERLDKELEEGYRANAEVMLETAHEFEPLVSELLKQTGATAIKE